MGERGFNMKLFMPENVPISDICAYCNETNPILIDSLSCSSNSSGNCKPSRLLHKINKTRCVNGYPGFGHDTLIKNLEVDYPKFGEYRHGKEADIKAEVFQDVDTTFFLLLAIYFPAVTVLSLFTCLIV